MRRFLRWLLLLPSASGIVLCLVMLDYGGTTPVDALALYSRQAAAMALPAQPQPSPQAERVMMLRRVLRLELRAARREQRADEAMWDEHQADLTEAAQDAAAAAAAAQAAAVPAPAAYVSVSGVGGAFGACVRAAENGGSYNWSTGNGGGAYQFLASTWAEYDPWGYPFGSATPAQQDQVFMNTIAHPGGYLNWSPYDGCWP